MTDASPADNASPRHPAAGYIEVARQDTAVLLRVHGLGNMNISLTMKDFVRASIESGYTHFALDLAPCDGMDSTFMGTMVGMCRIITEAAGWLCLLNVSSANQHLLDMVGVCRIVPIRKDFPLEAVEMERLEPDTDARRRLQHIQRAHQHLVQLDERNEEKFGHFLAGLEEEMKDESLPAEEEDDDNGIFPGEYD